MSFSVNFTFHHQDSFFFLPDMGQASMGQKDDRDKPPYAVDSCVFTQGWYPVEPDRELSQMGSYMGLVAAQVEPVARFGYGAGIGFSGHGVQGHEQVSVLTALNRLHRDGAGPSASQQGTHALAEFSLSIAMLGHLSAKVGEVEDQAIE